MRTDYFEKSYVVSPFLAGSLGRMDLPNLLEVIQDVATAHANQLNIFSEAHFWVLSRQQLSVKKWPAQNEEIFARTWLTSNSGAAALRNIQVFLDGQEIASSSTLWIALDRTTKRPVRVPFTELLTQNDDVTIAEPLKLALREKLEPCALFSVNNRDIDLNLHVNNVNYSRWVMDSIPSERYLASRVTRYEINFILEMKTGDSIEIFRSPAAEEMRFQGHRKADGKLAFIADLKLGL